MAKSIFDSEVLKQTMQHVLDNAQFDEIGIQIENDECIIGFNKLHCTSDSNIKTELTFSQFRKIVELLNIVDRQPILVDFENLFHPRISLCF